MDDKKFRSNFDLVEDSGLLHPARQFGFRDIATFQGLLGGLCDARVREAWAAWSPHKRREIVKVANPTLAETAREMLVTPEVAMRDLANKPAWLGQVVDKLCQRAEEFADQTAFHASCDHVRSVLRTADLPRHHAKGVVYTWSQDMYLLVKKPEQFFAEGEKLGLSREDLASAYVDGHVASHALKRLYGLFCILITVVADVRDELKLPRPVEARLPCGGCQQRIDEHRMVCSRCKMRYYCSKECQKLDWKAHKESCFDHSQLDRILHSLPQTVTVPPTGECLASWPHG
jgi:hypothetical protein